MKLQDGTLNILVGFILFCFYVLNGAYLQNLHYFNDQGLFFIEKGQILFDGEGEKLKTLGLTYPIIPFFVTLIFLKVHTFMAPIVASAAGASILFYCIINRFKISGVPYVIIFAIAALFFLHPGMIYLACSGSEGIWMLLFSYLFFEKMFQYFDTGTTYYIAIGSIFFMLLLSVQYNYIWLSMFLIPLVIILSLNNLQGRGFHAPEKLKLIFNNVSLRRKFISRTYAIYMILFILPFIGILLYQSLNRAHAGNISYFSDSPYANWNVIGQQINNYHKASPNDGGQTANTFSILYNILLISPVFVLALYLLRNNTFQLLALLGAVFYALFISQQFNGKTLPVESYLMFTFLAIITIKYVAQHKKLHAHETALAFSLLVISLVSGYMFLNTSDNYQEKRFITALTEHTPPDKEETADIEAANFIGTTIENNKKILTDDAAAYRIVAFTKAPNRFILPYQNTFINTLETPQRYADYILVSTVYNFFDSFNYTNSAFARSYGSHLTIRYANEYWKIYEVTREKSK